MIRIMVINIAFRLPALYVRWKLLAKENLDVDVTLIGPRSSDSNQYGVKLNYKPEPVVEERFKVKHINIKQPRWFKLLGLKGWVSWELVKIVKNYKPDFIYLIGYEEQIVSLEIGIIRHFLIPHAKVVCFTMRGTDYFIKNKHPLSGLYSHIMVFLTSKIFDAIICHYPQGRDLIIKQRKYKKSVYMQTQIGVDREIFYPHKKKRNEIRRKYGITDQFVFGSVSRIDAKKGIFDIIEALPEKGNWRFLMIGGGKDFNLLKEKVKQKGLERHVIIPGYIAAGKDITSHMNAMDCFVHAPRTTQHWVDTFPGVVPEAMATALPVIGSDSGAVPYQLGGEGIIIPEGNVSALKQAMINMMSDPDLTKQIGQNLYNRVMKTFEIRHLTKCFNVVMRDILNDKSDEGHIDQTSFCFD